MEKYEVMAEKFNLDYDMKRRYFGRLVVTLTLICFAVRAGAPHEVVGLRSVQPLVHRAGPSVGCESERIRQQNTRRSRKRGYSSEWPFFIVREK